jgi:hypothetical protein
MSQQVRSRTTYRRIAATNDWQEQQGDKRPNSCYGATGTTVSTSCNKPVIIRNERFDIDTRIAVAVRHVLRRSSLARTNDLSRFIPAREPRARVSRFEYRVAHETENDIEPKTF